MASAPTEVYCVLISIVSELLWKQFLKFTSVSHLGGW